MYEIIYSSASDLAPLIALENRYHEVLTDAIAEIVPTYEEKTWHRSYRVLAQEALNDFFVPVPGTEIPAIFVDRELGVKLVRERLGEYGGTVVRKTQAGAGNRVTFGEDRAAAVRADRKLHLARIIFDVAAEAGAPRVGSPFVREGWTPDASVGGRAGGRDGKRWISDTGRLWSVFVPEYEINASGDPHLHAKIDVAFRRFGTKICVRRGWQAKEDWRCRGSEGFEATFRSLYEGARMANEARFARLALLPDKPTGPELVKLAAFSRGFAPVFYDEYLDGERKELDPNGWGREEYEKACWAGDQAALDAPLFYNHWKDPLTVDTARVEFTRVVKRAGIRCGERHAWMHLGRHEATIRSLDEIEAMDLPEYVKERLRDDLAEYMGWSCKEEMLAVYGARHYAARQASSTVAFQDGHGGGPGDPFRIGPVVEMAPDLADLFDR
jgi:hypothetical protein